MSITLLKENNSQVLQEIYTKHRAGFIGFASKYNLELDDVLDIYQDAILAMVENARKGKMDHLKSDIKTYLFAIGKYMIFDKVKKNQKAREVSEELKGWFEWEEEDDNPDLTAKLELALESLGEQCYKILKLFYFESKKSEEILNLMNYPNKDVLKSQKWRCLKQLKEIILRK